MSEVSARIKAFRLMYGLTQKELGERMGLTEASIAQYESGKRNPKVATLQRFAKALGIDFLYLVRGLYAKTSNGIRRSEIFVTEPEPEVVYETPTEEYRAQLLEEFDNYLNARGQERAVIAVHELTYIPRYKKPTGSEGDET